MAMDGVDTAEDVISTLQEQLGLVATKQAKIRSFAEVGPVVMGEIEAKSRVNCEVITMGMPTGIAEIDQKTLGLHPGEMTLLGGYQADGKTSLAIQIMATNAMRSQASLLFTHESYAESVYKRVFSLVNGIPYEVLRDPRKLANPKMFENLLTISALQEKSQWVSKLPIYVDDASSMNIRHIRAATKAHVRKYKTTLVVVDFLQKLKAQGNDPRTRITAASEGLREMAKEENVHVIALSQLSRPENRKKERPTRFSFRESEGPFDDASLVLVVYRPENEDGEPSGYDEIICMKQREGQAGFHAKVRYNGTLMTYEDRIDYSDKFTK
jgi:replicative DNA helicase